MIELIQAYPIPSIALAFLVGFIISNIWTGLNIRKKNNRFWDRQQKANAEIKANIATLKPKDRELSLKQAENVIKKNILENASASK